MTDAVPLIEMWRGPFRESVHLGHAVVCDETGQVVEAWGDPDAVILPRSTVKMIQALPMVEAGLSLTSEQVALAASSHEGAAVHMPILRDWLAAGGFSDGDLVCGREAPRDRTLRHEMIRKGEAPEQIHNQCSGKHVGFLHFHKHLGATDSYVDPDGAVQTQVRQAFEEVTGEASPGYGIDGCAAPNFATSMTGLARAMAGFARARTGEGARADAMVRLREAMMAHPVLVANAGAAATRLMQAAPGQAALKNGAEGVFVGILPERRMGVAVKILDGAPRAAQAAMAAILGRLKLLDADGAAVREWINAPILNRADVEVGEIRPADALA